METRKNRVSVADLRVSDDATLLVLTQDILRLPLGQYEPSTLLDLLALSETGDGLPTALARDLDGFRERVLREVADLPDGAALAAFANEIATLPQETVPKCLRESIASLIPNRRKEDALDALRALLGNLEGTEPAVIDRSAGEVKPSQAEEAVTARTPAKKKAAPKKKKKTSRSAIDPEREAWIRACAVERVSQYESGLKESLLVAGIRHRAPWDDVTEAEARAVLRKMGREDVLKTSVGRWSIKK